MPVSAAGPWFWAITGWLSMIDQPSTLTLVTALNDTLERICPSRVAVVIEPSVSAQWWTY
jgi:hypothetical protein